MANVQKLKELIDQAEKRQDITCSEELARFLDEQGVIVPTMPIEIGTPVWCLKAKMRRANGYMMHCVVDSAAHYEWLRKNGAEFYIYQKPFRKSDFLKLGRVYFLSKEEVENRMQSAECRMQN